MSEWISVEDRLPEAHQPVLIWSGKWMEPQKSHYYNGRFEHTAPKEFVTHWMPLPEPPTE